MTRTELLASVDDLTAATGNRVFGEFGFKPMANILRELVAVVAFLNRLPAPNADDQNLYRAASPISHASASSAPVLLLHGDADETVPYQQSVAMETALRG